MRGMARFDFIAAYLLANRKNGTIYAGSPSDLAARMEAHKSGTGSHFTAKYGCSRLVWYQRFAKWPRPSPSKSVSSAGRAGGRSTSSNPSIRIGTISGFGESAAPARLPCGQELDPTLEAWGVGGIGSDAANGHSLRFIKRQAVFPPAVTFRASSRQTPR